VLPNLIVIGAMKAGTTYLYGLLGSHPDVFMSDPKELRFFVDGEGEWHRGQAWYESNFAGAGDAAVRGEASPRYARAPLFDGVPARMASVIPQARLVYLVRQPVERMRAHYQQLVYDGYESRPAVKALRDREYTDYLDTSRYAFQLERYLEHYPLDRILVLTAEHLWSDTAAQLERVAGFLGIAPFPERPEAGQHATADRELPRPWRNKVARSGAFRVARRIAPRPVRAAVHRATMVGPGVGADAARLPDDLTAELTDRVRPDVARLRELLGAGFEGWGLL
jgi:hypothetical protein